LLHTEIETLTTGRPAGYPLIYKVVKDSAGHIGSVEDDEAFAAQELLAQEGIFAESAAAVAAGTRRNSHRFHWSGGQGEADGGKR
jgi:threonine synthase